MVTDYCLPDADTQHTKYNSWQVVPALNSDFDTEFPSGMLDICAAIQSRLAETLTVTWISMGAYQQSQRLEHFRCNNPNNSNDCNLLSGAFSSNLGPPIQICLDTLYTSDMVHGISASA